MLGRLLLIYAVVELMVTVGLAAAIGVGWTVLVLLGTFVLGLMVGAPMGGLQLSRQLMALRSGAEEPRSALGDGALTALATGLVVVPGLASTVLGLLLLMPPVRSVARPALTTLALRGFLRRIPLPPDTPMGRQRPAGDYIDGEVIDVIDVDSPGLPSGRAN
ncbi:FxsA family protein [Mycobacterium asiaticum]|uniref:Membrane protein FxsA n=1 Tax=Mycobacterium asiaticum TaxID=1790 RepID=A0A1A3N0M0_MYCAS|nr:FxsA family protein [Mycobacterium asiaticum]OBK15331.1 membrane protein FxsA [Mycobacterium asiaticum]